MIAYTNTRCNILFLRQIEKTVVYSLLFVPLYINGIINTGRQRSKVVAGLLEKEAKQRELTLCECVCVVEADELLNKKMAEWETTTEDASPPPYQCQGRRREEPSEK